MVNFNENFEKSWTFEIVSVSINYCWLLCTSENCDNMIIQLCYLMRYDEATQSMVFNKSGFDWDTQIDLHDGTLEYKCSSCMTRLDIKNEEECVYIPKERLQLQS